MDAPGPLTMEGRGGARLPPPSRQAGEDRGAAESENRANADRDKFEQPAAAAAGAVMKYLTASVCSDCISLWILLLSVCLRRVWYLYTDYYNMRARQQNSRSIQYMSIPLDISAPPRSAPVIIAEGLRGALVGLYCVIVEPQICGAARSKDQLP